MHGMSIVRTLSRVPALNRTVKWSLDHLPYSPRKFIYKGMNRWHRCFMDSGVSAPVARCVKCGREFVTEPAQYPAFDPWWRRDKYDQKPRLYEDCGGEIVPLVARWNPKH